MLISEHKIQKRSRSEFFKLNMIAKLLPNDATIILSDLYEKFDLLVIFDEIFCRKLGNVYSYDEPMLEIEVTGGPNNFLHLQKKCFGNQM